MTEPHITINGQSLSEGQAMAVRVAISDFISDMAQPEALGGDEHGIAMAKAYQERLSEVLRLMLQRS